LPNLQGRVPVGTGNGQGLSPYVIGEVGGAENVSLTINNLPAHTHTLAASTSKATTQAAANNSLLARSDDTSSKGSTPAIYIPAATSTGSVNLAGVGMTGNSLPVSILSPFLAITFVIALVGVFPSRN
jgi:microcystin-dependent protein